MLLFGEMPFRKSVAMATPEDPCDQKLIGKGVLYANTKVTKFQLPTPKRF